MNARHAILGAVMIGLAGCGGSAGKEVARTDQDYVNAMDVGRDSFDLTHADQARAQFETAYSRALLRDDLNAIRDAGYNLAVADLAMGKAQSAMETVRRVHHDMALRGDTTSPALDLVAMAAYCRLGRFAEASDLGRHIVTDNPALIERRAFFSGLAADGLGDTGGLAAALAAMPASLHPPMLEQTDRAELSSRLDFRQGRFNDAESQARTAVALRRDMLDYRGMARALDCAAVAAQGAGQMSRAEAYRTRAAQSRAQIAPTDHASDGDTGSKADRTSG